jgi:hypothetical protein
LKLTSVARGTVWLTRVALVSTGKARETKCCVVLILRIPDGAILAIWRAVRIFIKTTRRAGHACCVIRRVALRMLAGGTIVAVLRAAVSKATARAFQTIAFFLVLCAIVAIIGDECVRTTQDTDGGVGLR